MNRLRGIYANVEQYFTRLSSRERALVAGAGGIFVFMLIGLVSLGFSRAIHRRQLSIADKSKALTQIATLSASFRQRDLERRQLDERLRTPVRLFTMIDDISKRQGIEIGDMQDRGSMTGSDKISESIVEFDVNKLTLDKLTTFLNAIEHGGHLVKVKKIRIRTRLDDPNAVDASLTVATYSGGVNG
ncbi:MAG: type II secretion system protein GspM [Deltaproteobacteria bacterium]